MACLTVSRRFLSKLGALLFILVLYVFGAAFYSGVQLWQRSSTFDGDVRRLWNRSTWHVVNVLVPASRLEKTTLTSPACPMISPHLSKLLVLPQLSEIKCVRCNIFGISLIHHHRYHHYAVIMTHSLGEDHYLVFCSLRLKTSRPVLLRVRFHLIHTYN